MAASSDVVGNDMVEKMKEKMKADREKKAAAGPPKEEKNRATAGAAESGVNGDVVPVSVAEPLKMLADGVSAVRPATEEDEAIKRKEKLARERMGQEFEKMRREQKRLEEVRTELEKLSEPTRRDIEIIQHRLEIVDRDLKDCIKDHDYKKKAYEAAKEAMERKREEKSKLGEHLRM